MLIVAYDLELAERVRELLAPDADVSERKMFGGLAFSRRGHMAVVVSGQGGLMLRVGADAADEAERTSSATVAEMRGRRMTGWLRVSAEDLTDDAEVTRWVDAAMDFVVTLPPKN